MAGFQKPVEKVKTQKKIKRIQTCKANKEYNFKRKETFAAS